MILEAQLLLLFLFGPFILGLLINLLLHAVFGEPRARHLKPPQGEEKPFPEAGLPVEVGYDRDEGFLTVTLDMRGHSPGSLKIFPLWMSTSIGHRYGDQDLQVGDRSFDREFIVKANPESLVARLFSPERRADVIAALRQLSSRRDFMIDLSRDKLLVLARGAGRDPAPVVRAAQRIASFILSLQEGGEILWIAEPAAPGGQCQVCGTEMRDGVVHCAKCRTPHHEECWRYTGICSTYGCKETRYLVDGWKIQSPPPGRQKPSDWLEEEIARDRRETGGAVTEEQVWRTVEAVQREMRRFEQRQRERGG